MLSDQEVEDLWNKHSYYNDVRVHLRSRLAYQPAVLIPLACPLQGQASVSEVETARIAAASILTAVDARVCVLSDLGLVSSESRGCGVAALKAWKEGKLSR